MIDRRSLLRTGGVLAATGALASASPAAPAVGAVAAEAVDGLPTRNPLVEQRADPFITPPTDGMYYLTGSVPEYDRIVIRGASTLDGLSAARERTIWRRPAAGVRPDGRLHLGARAAPHRREVVRLLRRR